MALNQRTITAELKGWSYDGQMVEGRIFNDARGIFENYAAVKIIPDPIQWDDLGSFYLVRVTDGFGSQYFRLDKHEKDTS